MKLILSKIKTYFGKLDKLLLFMCIGIAFFAVFIQYTLYENDISSAVTASQYKTQIIAFIAGLVIAMALAAINYKYLAKLWFIYVPLAMGLTLLLFTPLGIKREGADDIGWLDLGIMTIQPSEILKLAFILSLAFHLSKVEDRMNEPIHFILLCIHGAIPTLLIRQTGDDGSALVFLFGALISFSTGSSWGVWSIMMPIAFPMAVAFDISIPFVVGAVIGGGLFGDQCSPISDTTVLSSTGASCNHIVHVMTQIPYGITVGISAFVGFLFGGLTGQYVLSIAVTAAILTVSLFTLTQLTKRRYPEKVH